MISKVMTGTSRQETGKVPVDGENRGQGINTRVGKEVSTTGQPSIDFTVEKTPPDCALVFGEEKKQFVASLCNRLAIEVCKKIDT